MVDSEVRVRSLEAGATQDEFLSPGHNPYSLVIGYLAVMPDHRGRGYINDILNEGVSELAATGVDRIRAATDMTNSPMGDAFLRNGWTEYERSIDTVWPAATPRNAARSRSTRSAD